MIVITRVGVRAAPGNGGYISVTAHVAAADLAQECRRCKWLPRCITSHYSPRLQWWGTAVVVECDATVINFSSELRLCGVKAS